VPFETTSRKKKIALKLLQKFFFFPDGSQYNVYNDVETNIYDSFVLKIVVIVTFNNPEVLTLLCCGIETLKLDVSICILT